jgi:hypothetical protein
MALNNQVTNGRIVNVTGLSTQLSAISSKLSGYSTSPISLVDLARYFDTPFIEGIAQSMGLSYSSAVSMAPILGTLFPLLVGAIILILLLVARMYLRSSHKLMENRRTADNWGNIYKIVIVATLLWMIATYLLLSYAASSAPFGAFTGAYSSSKFIAIAINGTPTAASLSCAGRIGSAALAAGKTPVQVRFNNGQCTTNNSTKTVDACMNAYASTNMPVVVLDQNTRNNVRLYSLYGTVLDASGNDAMMNLCYVSLMTS